MLILTRKRGESIYIGGRIKVTVVEIKGNQVRVGIEAPQDERVYREEIYLQILDENRQAAQAVPALEVDGMENLSNLWETRGPGQDAETTQRAGNKPKLSALSKASVKGQDIPVYRKRKKDMQSDE